MSIENVTVFGGSGFIGRYVVRVLARRGSRVRAAVRRPSRANFLRTMGVVGQIAPVAADLRDEATLRAALEGADAVVNLVAVLYERGGQRFRALHVDGAARVAELARAAGARRLVHVSAIGADPQGTSAYARTKAEGEAAVRAIFPDAIVVRPSTVFGAEDEFFNRFARMARLSPALPLIGGGHTLFQPVHVGDVAEGIVAALADPRLKGEIFEFGGPRIHSFRELMEILLAEIGRRRLLVPVPWPLAYVLGALGELLPRPPLTRDQVRMLRRDAVVAEGARTLRDLGIRPTAMELVLPDYLSRYRRGGRSAAAGFRAQL